MQKLIRVLKEIHGGENNQKILNCYEHLYDIYLQLKMYQEDILIIQKKITIYKALNGQDIEDLTMVKFILQLGSCYRVLTKYDDALRSYRSAEKIIKKLAATDPEAKREEAPIKKVIEDLLKEQATQDGKGVK